MGRGRPPGRAGSETEARILEKALDLFSRHGFFATSVRQIARAAGVRQSALYNYFPSKDAILKAVIAYVGAEKRAGLEASFERLSRLPLETMFEELAWAILKRWRKPHDRAFARLLMREGPRLEELGFRLAGAFQEASERLTQLIELRMSRGEMVRMDPRMVVEEFMAPLVMRRMCALSKQNLAPSASIVSRQRLRAHAAFMSRALELPVETLAEARPKGEPVWLPSTCSA